tara:strand:- start:1427 stop:2296 length:870 start_codon:yes stop_codon:yes gene_type:complete
MRDLNYQLKQLCRHNRQGSYATRSNREHQLTQIADQLHELGFRRMTTHSLKPKHVEALVKLWQSQNLSPGTIKNRMSNLRWWARVVNKQNVIARSNDFYGIPDRYYGSTGTTKTRTLDQAYLDKVKDPHVRMSLQLQAAFGLRREEALKIKPRQADEGHEIRLQASWTKGGKERTVPIRTEAQRQLLEQAKALAGGGSLIPANKQYIQQVRIYERQTANAGLSKMHGLRHSYAQNRYKELTGWAAPNRGGPNSKQLTPEQKEIDKAARLQISRELGHEREQITAVYLAR